MIILEKWLFYIFIQRSAFDSVLKPMDGVTLYRLEMKPKTTIRNEKNYMNIGEICFTKVLEMRRAL